jgi:hypothetical protein
MGAFGQGTPIMDEGLVWRQAAESDGHGQGHRPLAHRSSGTLMPAASLTLRGCETKSSSIRCGPLTGCSSAL